MAHGSIVMVVMGLVFISSISLTGLATRGSTCSDTDGEKNYLVKGSATGVASDGYQFDYPDGCSDAYVLEEMYCETTPKTA